MKIDFSVDGVPGTFERSAATGRATLMMGDERRTLQSPWDPRTHFATSTTRVWVTRLAGYDVEVTKMRARVGGGVRAADFAIRVDGVVVATATG